MQDVDVVDVPDAGAPLVELDDGHLLALARTGNQEAYGALFARYSYAAHRLARHLGQKEESEDVVAESFAQVLDLVRRGKGPERAFRAYLFTTIRHESARRAKARRRVLPTDDAAQIDRPVDFGAGELDGFERSAIRAAYESLPPRWRTVLWHLDVEGRKPHELGPLLDMTPNGVSALVYRARSGLREAYLQQHVGADEQVDDRACRETRSRLSAFVRGTVARRDGEKVHAHLQSCPACMAVHLDLEEVNRQVGTVRVTTALGVTVVGAAAQVGVGGLAPVVAHLVLAAKGLAAAIVPPAAAAALTTATIVGVASHGVVERPRTPASDYGTAATTYADGSRTVLREAERPSRDLADGSRPPVLSPAAGDASAVPRATVDRPAPSVTSVTPTPTTPTPTAPTGARSIEPTAAEPPQPQPALVAVGRLVGDAVDTLLGTVD